MTALAGHTASEATGSTLTGTPVVPGVGYGPSAWPAPRPELSDPYTVAEADRDDEAARFSAAVETVAQRLSERAANASGVASEVLLATATLAKDRGLRAAVEQRVAKGMDAPHAMAEATEQFATMFKQLGGLMAERVTDLNDIKDRVVAELMGQPEPGIPTPETPSALLADDLAPADTAGLDPSRVVAIATRLGGPTSHTAIIARQLGIPCVVAVAGLNDVPEGTQVLVDGGLGEVAIEPELSEAERRVQAAAAALETVAHWVGPGQTKDGYGVDILANVQDGAGARAAAESPAAGIGLFRTELCFLNNESEPTVEEQTSIYAEVLAAYPDAKVVVRTLDAGSDKPLAFVNFPDEANPSLGVRGLRIALADIGILDRQLDAIKAAAEQTGTQPWVMAPMVATVAEAKLVGDAVRARGLTAGVMIEVPAAAVHAQRILEHVDFLSIGTNDLTQYMMAADRLSAELASLTDPWQPALLTMVASVAAAGRRADKPVGVCGEAAADPLLACVLVGMGVTSLSCAAAAVRGVGAKLSSVTKDQCQQAAQAVLEADSPKQAREIATGILG